MVIVTAASDNYFPFLVNMLGSLHRNSLECITHIYVFDLGLTRAQVDFLRTLERVSVETIQPFCPHWRQWYAWKPYCIKTAMELDPATEFLWLDAGIEVLADLGSIETTLRDEGYFFVGLDAHLTNARWTTTECFEILGLDLATYGPRPQLSANVLGFSKPSAYTEKILLAVYGYAQIEKAIAPQPSCPQNRHDQSLFSLLAAKYECRFHNREIYANADGIRRDLPQLIYSCRRQRPFVHFKYLRYRPGQRYRIWRQWQPIYQELVTSRTHRLINVLRLAIPEPLREGVKRLAPRGTLASLRKLWRYR